MGGWVGLRVGGWLSQNPKMANLTPSITQQWPAQCLTRLRNAFKPSTKPRAVLCIITHSPAKRLLGLCLAFFFGECVLRGRGREDTGLGRCGVSGLRVTSAVGYKERGCGGISCPEKYKSTNSGATKPAPCLENERTNYAGLAEAAHEKQWTVAVTSWRTFLVHPPALVSAPHWMPEEHYK